MSDFKPDLAVHIEAVGHASPQWKSAKTLSEADKRNQQLSELRAENVRKAVEEIVKKQLPHIKIAVPARGVGSRERFPTVSEKNAAIDRSVVVTVELTSTIPTVTQKPGPPRYVYAGSKVWSLKVETIDRVVTGTPRERIFLRVRIGNLYTGKSVILAGWVHGAGGGYDPAGGSYKPKDYVKTKFRPSGPTQSEEVGNEITFSTKDAMDFDDWKRGYGADTGSGTGHWAVRLEKLEISLGLKTTGTQMVFANLETDPAMLLFYAKPLTFGLPGADAYVASGFLKMEGENPGDFLELAGLPDIIPTALVQHFNHGLIVSFPTGKANLHDLTNKERKELTDFVTNKARNIAALER